MDTTNPTPRRSLSRLLGSLLVLGLLILVVVIDASRRAAEAQLSQLSMKLDQAAGNQQKNQQDAQRIIGEVGKLYALPTDIQPTVATIVDVNTLRQKNAFYDKAENGDFLVVTRDRAILYRESTNMILDVVPVQLQQNSSSSTSSTSIHTAQ